MVVAVVLAAEESSDVLVTSIPLSVVSTIVVELAFDCFNSVDHHLHPDVCLRLCPLSCGGFDASRSLAIC
jgi:hypothetical protein